MGAIANRVVVAVILLAAVFAIFWSQSLLLWKLATLLVALFAAYEWARMSGLEPYIDSVLYAMLFGFLTLIGDRVMSDNFIGAQLFWAVMVGVWSVALPWWILRGRRLSPMVAAVWGMLALFAAWHAGARMFEAHSPLLLLALALVWVFDTVAFCAGRALGKSKLAPTISPAKTHEGFLGGWMAVLAAAAAAFWYLAAAEWRAAVLILPFSFFIAALATWGDLFESYMKRQADMKDSGTLLGGHGGVLDRLDATLPVLPFAALTAEWLVI